MRGAKSANSKLFKDFCNEAEMEKNKADGRLYFFIVPYLMFNVVLPPPGMAVKTPPVAQHKEA